METLKDDIYFQSTLHGEIRGDKHVYNMIKVGECTNETKVDGDPECATDEEIEDYLSDKMFYPYVIDKQANYNIEYDVNG